MELTILMQSGWMFHSNGFIFFDGLGLFNALILQILHLFAWLSPAGRDIFGNFIKITTKI
jgi:hypothetical protein